MKRKQLIKEAKANLDLEKLVGDKRLVEDLGDYEFTFVIEGFSKLLLSDKRKREIINTFTLNQMTYSEALETIIKCCAKRR